MNRIREMINSGKKPIGTFYDLGGQTAAECLGIAGLDFIIIDTEHGSFDLDIAKVAICAAERRGTLPFARVKDGTRSSILKMLDAGAKGIVIPGVKTIDEVKKIVEYGKFYPVGNRGFAPTAAGEFGFADFAKTMDGYFAASNEMTLIMPQCETAECLNDLENIAAVNGVDGIFVGPYDLSIALGKPGQMDSPVMKEAIAHILNVCRKNNKISLIFQGTAALAKEKFAMGYDCVAVGMDTLVLINAYKSLLNEIRD
jgi:4-hydroxy-2-oxoheptanedioate aldolase